MEKRMIQYKRGEEKENSLLLKFYYLKHISGT